MPERTPMLAGNWKMNGGLATARDLIAGLQERIGKVDGREVLIAPPYPVLTTAAQQISGSGILLAGQNLHEEDKGAFTGEVSGPMLREAGCTHVIVGHSERRQHFGETDEILRRKLDAALRNALTPIFCVGETLEQREADETMSVIERQVQAVYADRDPEEARRSIVAYEPVWAIGTGKVATPEQAQEVHAAIRRLLGRSIGEAVAAGLRILYGGSVKPDNIDALMKQPDVDGALVGGASLDAESFARIVRFQS